jgi:Tol biopolymer transport system component
LTDEDSDETRLTNNDVNDFEPSWSPDGEKIAFSALEMASTIRKSVMNADSIDQTGLTDNKGI